MLCTTISIDFNKFHSLYVKESESEILERSDILPSTPQPCLLPLQHHSQFQQSTSEIRRGMIIINVLRSNARGGRHLRVLPEVIPRFWVRSKITGFNHRGAPRVHAWFPCDRARLPDGAKFGKYCQKSFSKNFATSSAIFLMPNIFLFWNANCDYQYYQNLSN